MSIWLCTSFTFVIFVAFMNSWDVMNEKMIFTTKFTFIFYFWCLHELQECLECLGCVSAENTNRFVICIRNFGKIKAKIFYMHLPEIFESYNKYRFGKFPLLPCFPLLRKKKKNGEPQNWFFSAPMNLHLFEWLHIVHISHRRIVMKR